MRLSAKQRCGASLKSPDMIDAEAIRSEFHGPLVGMTQFLGALSETGNGA